MICANMIAFGKAAGAKKPYDAEVESITLMDGACINTGICLLSGYTYEIDLKFHDFELNCVFSTFAPEADNASYLYARYWNYFNALLVFNGKWIIPSSSSEYKERFVVRHTVGQRVYYIGSQIITATDDDRISDRYPLLIGIRRQGEAIVGKSDENGAKSIYGVRIYDEFDNLILSLMPVRLFDGSGGMFDSVSKTIFANATDGGAGKIIPVDGTI